MNKPLNLLAVLVACSSLTLAASHSSQSPTLKQARELMAGVCSSGAATGACKPCPDFVDSNGFEDGMTLEAATYGKFLNNKDTYALLDLSGCEAHVNNFGGSVLLKWRGLTRWDFVKYLVGLRSSDCLKFPALPASSQGRREVLLCRGGYAGMGVVSDALYPVDLADYLSSSPAKPESSTLPFLEDNTAACLARVSVQSLLSWQQVNLNSDAFPDLRVQVRSGSGKTGQTPEVCGDKPANVPTRPYTLEYTWDGVKFTPTAATRRALKALEKDRLYGEGS